MPIHIHWTAPVGALVLGGLRFAPAFWTGFVLLIVIHELGHAFLVRHYRLPVLAITVHGLGGECHYAGQPTPFQRAVIAWGGVWAQLALFLLVAVAVELNVVQLFQTPFGAALAEVLMGYNLILVALNLLPFGNLDGRSAWPLIPMLVRRWRARSRRGSRRRPSKQLPQEAGDIVDLALHRAAKDRDQQPLQ